MINNLNSTFLSLFFKQHCYLHGFFFVLPCISRKVTHNMQGEGRFNFQTAFYTDQSVLYRLLLNKDLCVWIKCSNSGPSVEIFFNLTSWQWNVKWRKMLIWNKINVHLDYKTGIWAGLSATKEISYLSWGGGGEGWCRGMPLLWQFGL